jgi:hypothetical protein
VSGAKAGFMAGIANVFILQVAFDLAFGNEIARIGGPWPMSQKCWRQKLVY